MYILGFLLSFFNEGTTNCSNDRSIYSKKSLLLNGTDYSSSAHNFAHFFCAAVGAKLLLFILNFFYTANIIPLCNVSELKIVIL